MTASYNHKLQMENLPWELLNIISEFADGIYSLIMLNTTSKTLNMILNRNVKHEIRKYMLMVLGTGDTYSLGIPDRFYRYRIYNQCTWS